MRLRFAFLGETQILRDGVALPSPAPRQRAVLARLALAPGRPVSADQLLDDVWGDDLPAGRAKTVAVQIKALRNLIEPDRIGGGTVIVTSPAGYTLAVDRADIDVFRFEDLLDDAVDAGGDPPKSRALAEDALELWRGHPFADVGPMELIDHHVDRLERLRLLAERLVLEARLAHGDHAAIVAPLAALVRDHPLDEALAGDLMTALSRSGRTGDALRVFADLRRSLADELGIEPSRELVDLEAAILAGGDEAPGTTPAPAPPQSAPRRAVPAELTSLVGRDGEVERVVALLADHRLVSILGVGGIGKTRLVQRVATSAEEAFDDGVAFVELAPVSTGSLVDAEIADALGVRAGEGAGVHDVIVDYLVDRRLLLVIDNCEHVVDSIGPIVADLLRRAPGLTVLATSRESLGVPGEYQQHVAGLPIGELFSGGAVDLFVDRAAMSGRVVERDDHTIAGVQSICRRLAGIPLAIELAAARSRTLSIDDIDGRLADSIDVLGRGAKTAEPRQRTLRGAIDWSYDLLDDDERALFRHLSCCVGGFDVATAAAVTDTDRGSVDDLLDRLVDRSLVEAGVERSGDVGFRLLEPIRAYAADRLAEHGEADDVALRHADRFLGLTAQAEPRLRGPDQIAWGERLDADRGNIRQALRTLEQAGRLDDAFDLCWHLHWYWEHDGYHHEAINAINSVLEHRAIDSADAFRVARAYLEMSLLAADITLPESVEYAQRGLDVADAVGDPGLRGWLIVAECFAARNTGESEVDVRRFDEGIELVEASRLVLYSEGFDAALLALLLAMARWEDGTEGRRRRFERAIAGFRSEGDHTLVCASQLLSAFLSAEGIDEWIEDNLDAAVEAARATSYRQQLAHALLFRSLHLSVTGRGRPVDGELVEAAHLLAEIGDRACWATASAAAANEFNDAGDVARAVESLAPVVRSLRGAPMPGRDLRVLIAAAEAAAALGAHDLAARLLGRLETRTGGRPIGQVDLDRRIEAVRAATASSGAAAEATDTDETAFDAFLRWAAAVAR